MKHTHTHTHKIKNKFISFIRILIISLFFVVQSCQKNEIDQVNNNNELFLDTKYNNDFKDLSVALSKAIKEQGELRSLIKNEALVMFDGDYDILLKNIKDKSIEDAKSKSRSTVKGVLNTYFNDGRLSASTKSVQDIIDELTEQYPDLQISIPVHAEEWDDENFIPKVTFIPEEYDEASTQHVAAYNDGVEESLDAVTPPNNPVIVVSLNERLLEQTSITSAPVLAIELSAMAIESGVRLTWIPSTNTGGTIQLYHIYRKQAGQSNFELYHTNYGIYNTTFDDINTESNVYYSYYVTASNTEGDSDPSNIVNIQAPVNNPNNVLSFDAIHLAINDTELRWNNDYSEYFEGTKIFKKVVGVDSDYNLFGTYNPNTHYITDTNLTVGKRINYVAQQYSGTQLSNAKYDFVRIPYRDISQPSNIYIEKIQFDDWRIEGWLAGKPEFKLTIAGVNPLTNSSYAIQDKLEFYFSCRHSYNNFNGRLVLPWDPTNWYEMLSFNLVEFDRNRGNLTINLSAKYKNKNASKTNFNAEAGIDYSIKIDKKDENCGNGYINYYDPSSGWIYFPQYGARIYYSTVDANESSCSR